MSNKISPDPGTEPEAKASSSTIPKLFAAENPDEDEMKNVTGESVQDPGDLGSAELVRPVESAAGGATGIPVKALRAMYASRVLTYNYIALAMYLLFIALYMWLNFEFRYIISVHDQTAALQDVFIYEVC